jgi:hypothetical protein
MGEELSIGSLLVLVRQRQSELPVPASAEQVRALHIKMGAAGLKMPRDRRLEVFAWILSRQLPITSLKDLTKGEAMELLNLSDADLKRLVQHALVQTEPGVPI